ncbi:MAG: rhodanese-like domain-containing protein [Verrucomicrobiales bacterium]
MEISVTDLMCLLKAQAETLQIIDCREEEEWQYCHIDRSELIPLSQFAQQTAGWDCSDKRKKIIYCHHGMRSLQATKLLRTRGFKNTFSLMGGIDAWSVHADPEIPRY